METVLYFLVLPLLAEAAVELGEAAVAQVDLVVAEHMVLEWAVAIILVQAIVLVLVEV
jgi:hypothetical protein